MDIKVSSHRQPPKQKQLVDKAAKLIEQVYVGEDSQEDREAELKWLEQFRGRRLEKEDLEELKARIDQLKEDLPSPLRTEGDDQKETSLRQMVSVALVAENGIMQDVTFTEKVKLIGVKQKIYPPSEPKKLSDLGPWQLPTTVPTFVERPEVIDKIKSQLEQKRSVVLSALSGLGGIGKTQLAVYYSKETESKYKSRL